MKIVRWIGIITMGLAAALFMLSVPPADGDVRALSGVVEVDTPDVQVTIYASNETTVEITGYGMLEEKTGLNSLVQTSLRFSLDSGSRWPATISPTSTIDDIVVNAFYDYRVTVTIPPGTQAGEMETFTIIGVFEDVSTTFEASASFVLRTAVVDAGNNNGGDINNTASSPESQDGPPTILIVFIIGLLVLLGAGGFWAYRNVEIVKDPNGDRRIYLREKDTGRPLRKVPRGGDEPDSNR